MVGRGETKIGQRLTEKERDERASSRGDRKEMRCKCEMYAVRKLCGVSYLYGGESWASEDGRWPLAMDD